MITCAINDPKIIRLLYADITAAIKATPNDQVFDHISYMKDLYADFAKDGSPEVAAKYLQSVPRLIIDAGNTYFENKDVDYNKLKTLSKDFKAEEGINKVIDTLSFKEDLDNIKAQILLEKSLKNQVIEIPVAKEAKVFEPVKLKTLSPFGGTLQSYIKIDPSQIITTDGDTTIIKVEEINPELVHMFKTFEGMREAQTMSDLTDGITYDGVKLYYKAHNLDQFAIGNNEKKLDSSTREDIIKSRKIRKNKDKVDPNIAQVNQRVILVLSDQFGNPVYADSNGKLVTEEEGGKLVYQFMRVVRKNNKEYTVRDVYNETDQVISPVDFAKKYYNPETDGDEKKYLTKVVAAQQSEMKDLYDVQQKVLAGFPTLLPITDLTTGVATELSNIEVGLKDLINFPGVSTEALASIKTDKGGFATITLNGNSFSMDRPYMTEDIANEIASVLTNPELDLATKKIFTDQFIPSTLDSKRYTKKYQLLFNTEKEFIYFNIYDNFGDKAKQLKDLTILLSQSKLKSATLEDLATYKATIIKYLTEEGLPSQGKKTFMSYDKKSLNSRNYLRLAPNGKGFVNKPYFDLLAQSDAKVSLINADPGFYNYVVNFTTPDSLLGQVVKLPKTTNFKSTKDKVVSRLKEDEQITGTINQDSTKDTLWDVFEADGNKISFYNKGLRKLTEADKGKSVSLVLQPEVITEDGKIFNDVVEVYLNDEYLGNVAETDFGLPVDKIQEVPKPKSKEVSKAEVFDEVVNPGAESPESIDSPVAKIFESNGNIDLNSIPGLSDLYRRGIKKEFINPVKVLKAKRWWNSKELAPLRDVISLEHMANIVNSDVFATFMVSGAALADPNGKLGTIKVNKENGSFYQNLTSYHEAWHVFSQLFLTKQQKLDLYNELRNYTDASGNQPHITKSYRELEEILAEDFRNYVKTGKAKEATPKRNTLFRRILNALKQFFGKALNKFNKNDIEISSLNSPMAKALFDNLYLGKFNSYQASIHNAMLFSLDRGITQVSNPRQTALSPQDSELIVDTIDSIFSELIDDIYKNTVINSEKIAIELAKKAGIKEITEEVIKKFKPSGKSSSIVMLTDPQKRAWMYSEAKKRLQEALDNEQLLLEKTSNLVDFSTIKNITELKNNAVAVLKSKDGKDKYFYLSSQINDYSKLTPTLKNGERVKGDDYRGSIKIVGDYYRHLDISKKGSPADIIVISKLEDAHVQLNNYIKGQAKNYTAVIENSKIENLLLSDDQQIIRDNIRILQHALRNWGDEKTGVIKYHSENTDYEIAKTKFEVLVDDNENSTEVATEEMNNDMLQGKLSLQQMMSKETIYILKSLFKVDKDGNIPVNRLGFKERADFADVFTIVAKAIGGERDRYVAYEKLREEATKFPEIKQLFDTKYPNPANIKNVFEYNISRQFLQDFGKFKIKYSQLFAYTEDGALNFQVKESSLAIDNTLNRWSGKFKSSPKTQFIIKTKNNLSVLNLNNVVDSFKGNKGNLNVTDSLNFARAIGIDMQDNANITNELNNNSEYYGLQYIFDIVKDFNDLNKLYEQDPNSKDLTKAQIKFLEEFKLDPVDVMRKPIPAGVLKSLKGTVKELTQLKRLAELQTKYGYDSATTGVIRANGNTGYQEMNWSSAAAKVYALNNASNIKDLWSDPRFDYMSYLNPEINTYTRHLTLLNNSFNINGDGSHTSKSIQLLAQDGFSVANADGTTDGNTTTELDTFSKFLFEFHSMSLGGVAEFPRTSDKKFSYGMKLVGGIDTDPVGYMTKGKDLNLYVDLDKFVPTNNTKITGPIFAVGSYMFGYLQGEFDRIKKFRGANKDQYLNFTGYNQLVNDGNGNDVPAGAVFSAFDTILTQDTKNALYELADQQVDVDLIDFLTGTQLKKDIVKDILEYFNEKTDEIQKLYFDKFGYISRSMYEKVGYNLSELTNDKLKELGKNTQLTNQLLKGYLYNDWIHKFETSILMFGDFAQFNHDKEDWSKRIPGLTSDGTGFLFDEGTIDFINNYFNKTTYASKLGKEYDNFQYSQKINTAVIKDAVRESIYLDDFIEAWTEEYSKIYDSATVKKIIEADKKAYEEMKEGDGMAYMTIDAYRTLHQTGRGWSIPQEALYQQIINGENVDALKVKDYFPVYKLHYFGAIDNDVIAATAMHKFAVVPLIPGVNAKEGSQLKVLHEKMLKENVQYVTFESGSKIVSLTKDGKVDDIFVDDAKAINQKVNEQDETEVPFTLNPIYLANLKEVTVINEKFKKQLPIATQTRGIVLDNLYSNGEVINSKNEPILNEYLSSVKDYTEILKEELLNNIGFELIDGRYVGNLTEFVKIIREQLTQRDTPNHLVKLINTTEDQQLAMDLSLHPESDSIEKLLMSFIQKGLIKQNTNGESLVQTPTTFTNGLWDQGFDVITDKKEIKKLLGTNTLPFYIRNKGGRSDEMKVAIALQGEYKKLLKAKDNEGTVIGTLDRLNELLKDETWFNANKDAITLFGPRIPNDATNTIEAATVWHFLPEAFGNSIIVPTEIVAKAGSDYDGDKLSMSMANIDNEGTAITKGIEDFDKVLASTKKLEKENKLPEGHMTSKQLIRIQKRYLQNRYKNAAVEILMLPENYAYLVKPNGTYLVDKYVDSIPKSADAYDRYKNPHGAGDKLSAKDKEGNRKTVMSPSRPLDVIHNLFVHDANLSLEPSLGILAKLAKSHPIYKSIGAPMPATYKIPVYNNLTAKYEVKDASVDMPMVMRFAHNNMLNSKGETVISLSGERSQKGTRITDLVSHKLQGILDRAKESFPFDLKLVPEAMDVLSFMIQAGVDEENIFLFLNQPSVVSYFQNQNLRNGSMYKVFKTAEQGSVKNLSASDVISRILVRVPKETIEKLYNDISKEKLRATINQIKNNKELSETLLTFSTVNEKSAEGTIFDLINSLNSKKLLPEDINSINLGKNNLYAKVNKLNSTANYAFATKVLSDDYLSGDITKGTLVNNITDDGGNPLRNLAIFMNFIELEKQYAGMKEVQSVFSPDTAKVTTVQQSIQRMSDYKDLEKYTTVDQDFLKKLLNDSVIASFKQDELITQLIVPLFNLRLDTKITDFIKDTLSNYESSNAVKKKFGLGTDGEERFTNVFNNAVVNYIYQNYRSNSSNIKGELTNIPEAYDSKEVIVNDTLDTDVIVTENSIIINSEKIENDFANKVFLTNTTVADNNKTRGLDTFTPKQNPFDTLGSYYRYVIAREAIRVNTPAEDLETNKNFMKRVVETKSFDEAYESYISEKALKSVFNYKYIMGKTKYSYTETVMNVINEFGDTLKKAYPILSQLSPAPNTEGVKVIQLNNKKEAEGITASNYYKQLRNLADVTITKVKDPEDNQRISNIFEAFSLLMFYQHGIGNTKLGFIKVLDPSQRTSLITNDVQNFKLNYLNAGTLNDILNKVLDNQRFKNFTISPQEFKHASAIKAGLAIEEGVLESFDFEEDINLVKGETVVFQDDVNLFKAYLKKSKGKNPQTFFTPNSTFGKFYNSATGKREVMPQSAKWELQTNGLYDMVDQDPDSGEVYYENVDLTTGFQMVDPKAPKAEQSVEPSNAINEFAIADTLAPIEQNFKDGQGGRQMQDQFKGKSTMDLIISGDRTRTTRANTDIQRMAKDYGLSKISDLVGKVIRMTDKTGKEVYTRITEVAPFTQEYQDATWQKEGWKKEVTDKNVGNYPYAIEFEVVTTSTQPATSVKTAIEGTNVSDYSIADDMAEFNKLVEANKGALPKTFTVGKRNWVLNPFGNYDSVDSETGEIYIRNANMQTGILEPEAGLKDPITPELKAQGLEYLETNVDDLVEPLAELGYDIKDLMNNLANAKTFEDYNKVQEILNKLC
jgi:hypothetical protein